MENARAIIEVRAGVIPGEPVDGFTRQWALTYDDVMSYNDALGAATLYAISMMNPREINWVKLEWVWL